MVLTACLWVILNTSLGDFMVMEFMLTVTFVWSVAVLKLHALCNDDIAEMVPSAVDEVGWLDT